VGEVERDDHMLRTSFDMSYRTTRWCDLGLGVAWKQRGSADGAHPDVEYEDLAVTGGVTFTY
jgi:hypothetical protein